MCQWANDAPSALYMCVVPIVEIVLFGIITIIAAAAVVVTVRLSVAIPLNGQELCEDVNL